MRSHGNRSGNVTEVMEKWRDGRLPHPGGRGRRPLHLQTAKTTARALSRIRFDPVRCARPWFAYDNCALMKFLLGFGLLHAFKGLFKLRYQWRLASLQAVASHDAPQVHTGLVCVVNRQTVF
jgi:hypothetical protein